MPALGFGTLKLPEHLLETSILEALRTGYRHIDTAPIHQNEPQIGAALKKGLTRYPREELWVTSKLWCDAHKPEAVLPALQATLSNLQLDYLDLFLVQFPIALKHGVVWPQKKEDYLSLEDVPLADTWKAMEECVRKGLVREIGVSNFSVHKLESLLETATIAPAVNQIEIHPYLQQKQQISFAREHDIVLTAFAPLGSEKTMMEMEHPTAPPLLSEHPVVKAIAVKHNATPAQVLLAWLLHQNISAIPSSSSAIRIQENFASQSVNLTTQDMEEIATMHINFRLFDLKVFTEHDSPYTMENIWDGEL